MLHVLPRLKQRDVKLGILMDGDRVVFSIRAGDQSQLAPLLFCRKLLLLMPRLDAAPLGENPNLEQMGSIRLGGIGLAVPDARTCAHPLPIPWADYRTISHAVLMFESAFQQISDDLHVAMRMRGKTMARLHPIFVDDSKGAESHVAGIVILIKGEAVASVQPPVVASTPFVAA